MRFVVTGTPRSATKYTARLLTALGVPCSHENILRPMGQVVDFLRWYRDAEHGESSWMAWTLLDLFPGDMPVIHTIRDPWKVIDSLTNRNSILKMDQWHSNTTQSIRDTITAYLPCVFDYEHRVDRAAAFVVGWNELIAERVPIRFLLYADRPHVKTIQGALSYIGASADVAEIAKALAEVPTSTNEGYTVVDTAGVTDPHVAQFIREYAEDKGVKDVFTRRIKNTPDRQTPQELIDRMSPELVEEVSAYAARHGYLVPERAAIAV